LCLSSGSKGLKLPGLTVGAVHDRASFVDFRKNALKQEKTFMAKHALRFLGLLILFSMVVTAVYAGGWAIVTLKDLPNYAVAGKPLTLTFAVRQHGVTFLSDLQPSVSATSNTSNGVSFKSPVTRGNAPGEYVTTLTFREAGEWTINIDSGFNSNAVKTPVLKVIAAGTAAPTPFSPMTRGLRLFTAKGCVGCHRHIEVNPERTTDARFDLSGRRFQPEYLTQFLADPSIKTLDMPNLKLKPEEIDALAAFISKVTKKTVQDVRREQ